MAQLNQYFKGEDIVIQITGDDTFVIHDVYTEDVMFTMLMYPNNLDLTIEDNRAKVVECKSSSRIIPPDADSCYVTFNSELTEVSVIIPWKVTQPLDAGDYTVEIVWGGSSSRVIFRQNSMVTLVDSGGEYVDSNMDFDENEE